MVGSEWLKPKAAPDHFSRSTGHSSRHSNGLICYSECDFCRNPRYESFTGRDVPNHSSVFCLSHTASNRRLLCDLYDGGNDCRTLIWWRKATNPALFSQEESNPSPCVPCAVIEKVSISANVPLTLAEIKSPLTPQFERAGNLLVRSDHIIMVSELTNWSSRVLAAFSRSISTAPQYHV